MIALNAQIWMLGGGGVYILNINGNFNHLLRLLRKRNFLSFFFLAFFKDRVHFVKGHG